MHAREKLSFISDQDVPRAEERDASGRKNHGPREGEEAKASDSTVQPPIQRPDDGPEVAPLFSSEAVEDRWEDDKPELTPSYAYSVPREPDDPEPSPNNTTVPIQRPDDTLGIVPRFGSEVVEDRWQDDKSEPTPTYDDFVPREPDDPEVTENKTTIPINREEPASKPIVPRTPALEKGAGR